MDTKISSNATPKPHDDYYLGCILKIAAAATVELPEASQAVYLERLRKLNASEIQTATERTIGEWDEACKMPPLAFITARAYREPDFEHGTSEILSRPDKPEGWQPIADASATERALTRLRGAVTREEIAQWLEEGKAKARARYALLAADPKWRAPAAAVGVPEYRQLAESLAAARNGPTTVPSDPEERRSWTQAMALKNGWKPA